MQIINVDLIPGKVMPILHASQFDKGRALGVKLYNGGAVFELSGAETLTAAVRKPDGNIVTETLTNAGGSLVEIITTEQMTACAGCSLCEIKIENAGDVIGTANFVLEVEEDPLDGGIESESEINNLATQVAQLVSEQYDSGNVIFDNEPTEGHGNGYTVTSEGIKAALDAINNPDASAVNYDNTDSGLAATNAQDAIDEVNDKADTNAANIGSLSTLTTTDKSSLVGAVNEVNDKADNATIPDGTYTVVGIWGESYYAARSMWVSLPRADLYNITILSAKYVSGTNTLTDITSSVSITGKNALGFQVYSTSNIDNHYGTIQFGVEKI